MGIGDLAQYVQQSPDIASTIDSIAFFGAIASIIDEIFGKAKSANYLQIFALPK